MRRSERGDTVANDGNAHDDISMMDRIAVTPNTNITNASDGNEHHDDTVTDVITNTGDIMSDTASISALPSQNMGTVYFDGLRRPARINAVLEVYNLSY